MKLASALFLTLLSSGACAADIASCSNPSGKGYYPEKGIISAQDSGWEDERITNGITKLVRQADGGYDVLFVDVRNEIVSALQDGALVVPLNRGEDVFSVLVVYPGKTAEVYTFLRTTSGKLEYIHTLSRAGDSVFISKASVMRGDCAYINFGALPAEAGQ
ncbi:hypothetical protein [Stenotrophomonas sp. Marseille-Q4652]|uniref:hypothetical protein n=1 Tax=Stenotrophomonas sp. Marseille-Q4652 TaxID=2866595 RepID=UPI001CE42B75|nr:hypothetical protein [Stenotrophomonas sp. Marseille-Q4652]